MTILERLYPGGLVYASSYALRLRHIKTGLTYWLHRDLTMTEVKEKYEKLHPMEECK